MKRLDYAIIIALLVAAPGQLMLLVSSVRTGIQDGDPLLVTLGVATMVLFCFVFGSKLEQLTSKRRS